MAKWILNGFPKKKSLVSRGTGSLFLFPLTRAAVHYEFYRGVLAVLAPKAKVAQLVTPKSLTPTRKYDDVQKTELRKHLSHVLQLNPQRVRVVDGRGLNTTFDNIVGGLRRASQDSGVECPEIIRDLNFETIDRHLFGLGFDLPFLCATWWQKEPSGASARYRASNSSERRQFAKERLYFYRLGRVYANAFLEKEQEKKAGGFRTLGHRGENQRYPDDLSV
ncbi:hypothetical protein HYV43_05795 [Candidatus Micrarchaeota archaeon]|nr:hypothetical protein [Candidatus Micrarchaeota archaeon]